MQDRGQKSQPSRVTDTGWRLVGDVASVPTAPESLALGDYSDCVYATRVRVRPWLGTARPLGKTLEVLGASVARDWQDISSLPAHESFERPSSRFQGLRWETEGTRGAWIGELHWRYPHPVVRAAACQAHVVLVEQEETLTMTVRVFVTGGIGAVRGFAGVGQACPPFMAALHHQLRLITDWGDVAPKILSSETIEGFVNDTVLSESRNFPIAVLSPLEDGAYVLPPEELATELLGIAPLFAIDKHPTTFRLTDLMGDKRLSCFWGALRIYQPEFSCASPPEEHPLLLRDLLTDPFQRAELVGRLAVAARSRVSVPPSVADRRAPTKKRRQAATAVEPPPSSSEDESDKTAVSVVPGASRPLDPASTDESEGFASTVRILSEEIRALAAAVHQLATANRDLHQEVAQLRTASAVRAGSAGSSERRIARIDRNLEVLRELVGNERSTDAGDASPPDPSRTDEAEEEVISLHHVVRNASSAHADALLVLDSAERSATESPFEDVDRVATVLDAMAEVARRRQRGGLGMSIRDAFREYGIDYRGAAAPSTSEKLRAQYQSLGADGTSFDCQEHIVLGSTYDPRYCLRIYFTSRAALEPRFVIGHVGRHFDVKSTT